MYSMALVTNRLEQHMDVTTPTCAAFQGAGHGTLCGVRKCRAGVLSHSYSETDVGGILCAFVTISKHLKTPTYFCDTVHEQKVLEETNKYCTHDNTMQMNELLIMCVS